MLHILDGESSAGTLGQTNVPGKIFAWREVFMTGPTPFGISGEEWCRLRAQHLSQSYGVDLAHCEKALHEQEKLLETYQQHEETVLWFEHDLFCQTNLLYLLNWFADRDLTRTKLSLISIDRFPGRENFRGLGELSAVELASLFEQRQGITPQQLKTAVAGWQAYCSSYPRDVETFLKSNSDSLPFLKVALRLHLKRFPSLRNGLGRVQNVGLELLATGIDNFADLFTRFRGIEPVYGLGDLQFWLDMKRLSDAKTPLLIMSDGKNGFAERNIHNSKIEITDMGRHVLSGEADFVDLNGIDYWLGGVHLQSDNLWRWDDEKEQFLKDSSRTQEI